MTTPHPANTGLQQYTGYLLRRAYVASRRYAEACVEDDATLREFLVMSVLDRGGAASQRRLGERSALDRTTTGKIVEALQSKGWLERQRDERDRRSYSLRLTDSGTEALRGLQQALDRSDAHLTDALSRSERERLTSELQRLLPDDHTLDIAGLGDRCGYLIARAHRAMLRQAESWLSPLGLSPRDFGILSTLAAAQPCSQQRLAELVGISAPAMLGFVDELEAEGLVARRRNAAARRAYDLTLTPEGAEKLGAARRQARQLQASICEALGSEAEADLRGLLGKVIATAVRPAAPAAASGPASGQPDGGEPPESPPSPVDAAAS